MVLAKDRSPLPDRMPPAAWTLVAGCVAEGVFLLAAAAFSALLAVLGERMKDDEASLLSDLSAGPLAIASAVFLLAAWVVLCVARGVALQMRTAVYAAQAINLVGLMLFLYFGWFRSSHGLLAAGVFAGAFVTTFARDVRAWTAPARE